MRKNNHPSTFNLLRSMFMGSDHGLPSLTDEEIEALSRQAQALVDFNKRLHLEDKAAGKSTDWASRP